VKRTLFYLSFWNEILTVSMKEQAAGWLLLCYLLEKHDINKNKKRSK